MKLAIVILVVVVLLVLWLAGTYNGLVKKKNAVEEAFSTMDVYLKKRWDLIPNLVNTVKGYAAHEAQTLQNVVAARAGSYAALSTEEKLKANAELSGAIAGFSAVVEQYPDLKANQNFLDLQNQLRQVEADIANARKYYNATVKQQNNKIEMFPSNIVAGLFRFEKRSMYLVDDAAQRENVKVEF